jgi:hypothetical protein
MKRDIVIARGGEWGHFQSFFVAWGWLDERFNNKYQAWKLLEKKVNNTTVKHD